MRSVERAQRGLSSHSEEYSVLRERWAALTNHALREANVEARVDHRSLAAQGVDRKPLLRVPLEFYQLERNGMPKEAAERLREDYRARLSAYRERSAGPKSAEAVAEPRAAGAASAASAASAADGPGAVSAAGVAGAAPTVAPRNSEEIRRRAVQAWLHMRSRGGESTSATTNEAAVSRGAEEGRDR